MRRMGILTIVGGGVAALILGAAFAGERPSVTVVKQNAEYVSPTDGHAMYNLYCASCHGFDGRGYGPALRGLKEHPVDLTRLSAKNDGEFPAQHVRYVLLDAGPNPSHAREMPDWSAILAELNRDNPGVCMLRARSISDHLESIQERPFVARED
jgi:2-polyprenyl-6-methoxyphenol hydroxylase-like FAD-dependent oxidoreductase